MSIPAQFVMAAIAFTLGMIWTCITIKERKLAKTEEKEEEKFNFIQSLKDFFALSPEVGKICWMQFFTWIGNMCMMIYFTQYAVHTVFGVPDLSEVTEDNDDNSTEENIIYTIDNSVVHNDKGHKYTMQSTTKNGKNGFKLISIENTRDTNSYVDNNWKDRFYETPVNGGLLTETNEFVLISEHANSKRTKLEVGQKLE